MWLIRVFVVTYFATVCGAQDAQNVTSEPSLNTFGAPTVSEPPMPFLQLQSGWLDAFPSEKVELSCRINGSSDWQIVWHKDNKEQGENPDLSFSADRSVLTITAAAQTSGRYFCKGQHKSSNVSTQPSSPLDIQVYPNKPKAALSQRPNFDKMFSGESVTFTCSVDVGFGWEFQWYHDGNEVEASAAYPIRSVNHSNSGQYYCKAKRGKSQFSAEQSETATVQVSDPPTPSLKRLSLWLDVFETESVELACEVSGSDWTYTWYKNQQRLQAGQDEDERFFNITSVTKTDRGVYSCKAHLEARNVTSGFSNTATVTVYENTPIPTLTKVPDFTPMYVGETVQFTCTVDVASDWKYQWSKDGQRIPYATKANFSFPLLLFDGGNYSCMATRGATSTSQSAEIQLTVHEIPVPHCENMTQWLDVFPSESVRLSCGMPHGSGWTYTWYRAGEEVKAGEAVSFDAAGSTLSISPASLKHAAQYSCRGHLQDRMVTSNSSSELTLRVYAEMPSVVLTQDPEYEVMFPGESVSFSCHMNVSSGWEYFFYKSHQQLSSAGIKYSVNLTGASDGGSYTCQVKRGMSPVFSSNPSPAVVLDVKEKQPKPVVTQEPKADKVYIGESVTLDCQVEISSGWEYLWNKDGVALPHKSRTFKIHDANSSDSGNYVCTAKRQKSAYLTQHGDKRALQISEIPVPQLKQMTQWLDVFPSERAELRCGMEEGVSDWTYSWYKDGKEVHADDTVSFDSDATALSIISAAAQHGGRYSCSGKLKSRPVYSISSSGITLSVYDAKPKVTLMQKPDYEVMHTGDSVSFSCHINVSSGWKYTWYKDGTLSSQSGNNYSISSVEMKNSGSYTCQGKRGVGAVFQSNQSPAVELQIQERPQASIILLTGWSQVFATDSLELRCEVLESSDQWNFTWFREGISLDLSPSETHVVTPQNDPEQGQYTCRGVRNGRPSYSKSSSSYRTKNLLLKRRLLLSISGCLFFGLILVFGGCIVLRITRKPVVEYDKPEEENLFLTMAQLKDRTDAPNPLVEYITDEGIEALSKEVEENGTLPITTEEVPAVTTESNKTEESEVGLVSFKQ